MSMKNKRPFYLSAGKFRRHLQKEIQQWLGYHFCDLNDRSPDRNVQGLLADIRKKTGGMVYATLDKRSRQVSITVKVPVNYVYQLEYVDDHGADVEKKAA
ncbi:MAG: hypothetical protein M0P30_14990 [Syntrophorhabdaceae bacterium]|nr:hypothetical protein [Syntrophorhabdaceae bacterium]